MKKIQVLESIAKKLKYENVTQMQKAFGHTNLYSLAQNKATPEWIGTIAMHAYNAGESSARESAVRTIVEFYPIDAKHAAAKKLLDADQRSGPANKYHHGLRKELEHAKSGIYVFFDSMGKAIYIGKTVNQNIWRRMHQSFKSKEVNQLYRVNHPKINVEYKSSEEKQRKLKPHQVKVYEVARYFSAYDVHRNLVGTVEALLIRTAANDLQNTRMEGN